MAIARLFTRCSILARNTHRRACSHAINFTREDMSCYINVTISAILQWGQTVPEICLCILIISSVLETWRLCCCCCCCWTCCFNVAANNLCCCCCCCLLIGLCWYCVWKVCCICDTGFICAWPDETGNWCCIVGCGCGWITRWPGKENCCCCCGCCCCCCCTCCTCCCCCCCCACCGCCGCIALVRACETVRATGGKWLKLKCWWLLLFSPKTQYFRRLSKWKILLCQTVNAFCDGTFCPPLWR